MTIRDAMTAPAVRIHPKETVWVAARMLERENIGALPVCGSDGRLCGVVTDRDIVTRCLAAGRSPSTTAVEEIMTTAVVSARPDMDLELAAGLMGRRQIPAASGDGKRQAVRDAQPGRPGGQAGVQPGCRRRADGDQRRPVPAEVKVSQ